jgi:hypothetical protein
MCTPQCAQLNMACTRLAGGGAEDGLGGFFGPRKRRSEAPSMPTNTTTATSRIKNFM